MQGGWFSGEKRDNFGTCLWKEKGKDWTTILDNGHFLLGMEEESVFQRTFVWDYSRKGGGYSPCFNSLLMTGS